MFKINLLSETIYHSVRTQVTVLKNYSWLCLTQITNLVAISNEFPERLDMKVILKAEYDNHIHTY